MDHRRVLSLIVVLGLFLLSGCVDPSIPQETTTPEPTIEPTGTDEPTPEPSPTALHPPEPTGTETLDPTESATVPPSITVESTLSPSAAFTEEATETRTPTLEPTQTLTLTPTSRSEGFPTPTPIFWGGTPPVEITPLGGGSGDDGSLPDGTLFITTANLNLRSSPEVKSGNVIRVVSIGVYPASELVQVGDDDWVYICQSTKTPPCGYVAQFVDGRQWGTLQYPSPVSNVFNLMSAALSGTGGGGNLEMEFDFNLIITLLVTLAAMVPVLGGSAGMVIGLLVDVIKAVILWRDDSKEPTPGFFGILAIALNAVVWIGLFIFLRTVPAESLPADVDQWFAIAATVLTFVLTFLAQLKASGLSHGVLKSKAPLVFSVTERKRVRLLTEHGTDPEVAVFAATG